jgi:hypothetical protein
LGVTASLGTQKEKVHMAAAHEVNLGKKGSFKITRPGSLRAAARKRGMSSRQFAESHTKDKEWGSRARAALGLMGMHHGG